jgi:hypothetical protein
MSIKRDDAFEGRLLEPRSEPGFREEAEIEIKPDDLDFLEAGRGAAPLLLPNELLSQLS